ncbi:aminotransferase class V-fold PLP-dependent enzyme [Ramlibacter ginsenosidimutans]|uniref:Kynureninase n=1 Tax=Ramlibacter ginsenosidimutans TaxID=502333 RepID=A0A934WNW0_9BURK|nr:aminotransferase class V-fold PLP-dependent enzyme [Ramlibacter ginsenosidimutans]MBK6007970.1 aminotransferase class V-fold PLP-dependent enzyme [Ramlibacter ginsenosidimutans]
MPLTLADCLARDADASASASLQGVRDRFAGGDPDTLYFDANSIGPMPADVPARMQDLLQAGWAGARRRGWNTLDWLEQPRTLGAAIAPVIGARAEDVRVADSTSINQYKLLRYALAAQAPRRVIVLQRDVFPSNRYVAEGIAHAGLADLRFIDGVQDLPRALAHGDVAVVALSHVDYRSSERLDMAAINPQVRVAGALSLWDLSHSAGAVAIDLRGTEADLAVGCGYKYLCGGPGAPAFVYLHPRHADAAWPAMCGWMGHASTFDFEPDYRPGRGADRFLVGTPPVLAQAAFAAAAAIWREVDPRALDARHRSLTDTLIQLLDEQCEPLGVQLASPRQHERRGGHVAVRFEHAAPLAQALVDHGVVVSARKPDALRFAAHPLTATHEQLWTAVARLRELLQRQAWRDPRYQQASV